MGRALAETVLAAQQVTLDYVRLVIAKSRFYDRHREALNESLVKVIERMFREGPGDLLWRLKRCIRSGQTGLKLTDDHSKLTCCKETRPQRS